MSALDDFAAELSRYEDERLRKAGWTEEGSYWRRPGDGRLFLKGQALAQVGGRKQGKAKRRK